MNIRKVIYIFATVAYKLVCESLNSLKNYGSLSQQLANYICKWEVWEAKVLFSDKYSKEVFLFQSHKEV